ncbi:DUF4381 domain-containing protein [Microbulbifer elongatus]|uniref:DUF4381 domain-containing protein n=1 Tax=Microbulbifer elongatus TaxID=86173 RepID=UPI001E2B096E|nr:DUF4381 domain-containing protein [Microbulbifer elongatus]
MKSAGLFTKQVTPPQPQPHLTPEMQQLLEQLRDIHEPAPIGWWPLAPGWWILAGIIIALVVASFWLFRYLRRQRQKKMYRVEGVRLLDELNLQQPRVVEAINVLLKRVAVVTFGRAKCGPLTGERWIEFLRTTADTPMPEPVHRVILQSLYSAKDPDQQDLTALREYAKDWVRTHLVQENPQSQAEQQQTPEAEHV